jgi:hypothetical protein
VVLEVQAVATEVLVVRHGLHLGLLAVDLQVVEVAGEDNNSPIQEYILN